MLRKALLFINGEPPQTFPSFEEYEVTACTDGAFSYLKCQGFPLKDLDFVSGDFDSYLPQDLASIPVELIHTPDQNRTDFDKVLEILIQKDVHQVDVYGASGGEMDHFLGNLTVAYRYKDLINICFYDAYSVYYFIPNNYTIEGIRGRMVSLYPFPTATNISTFGLEWTLQNESLSLTDRIGTRNFAKEDQVNISFEQGALIFFLGK